MAGAQGRRRLEPLLQGLRGMRTKQASENPSENRASQQGVRCLSVERALWLISGPFASTEWKTSRLLNGERAGKVENR
jgi:hypothetical protein